MFLQPAPAHSHPSWVFEVFKPNIYCSKSRLDQETQGLERMGGEGLFQTQAFKPPSWNLASSDMPNCSRGSLPVIFWISFL